MTNREDPREVVTAASQPTKSKGAIDAALTAALGHLQAGRLQEAEAIYRDILAARPDHADANHCYGLIALRVGRNDIAVDRIERAIGADARKAVYHQNLGCALKALGRLDDAISAFQRALALRPDYSDAHYNLGNALRELERFDEAEAAYRAALDLAPQSVEILNNLGAVLQKSCRFEESVTTLRSALDSAPDDAETHFNLGMSLLALGRLEEGWSEYEYRLEKGGIRPPAAPAPAWDGEPFADRTILVYAEQGIGDEILFASCFPDLIDRAGHCVIACAPRLESLFKRSFPTATVHRWARDDADWLSEASPIDFYVMQASLMRHFRPEVGSFPNHDGYLVADAAARQDFADRLAALGPGLKIGISWRSMRGSRYHYSYTDLGEWHRILGLPGIQFVSLQYDDSSDEVAEVNDRFGVRVHDFADLDLLNDLDGVAALIAGLDLVIAPGNTVANIAGGLGTPLRLLDLATNWATFGTDTYPWFPSATVYRRTPDMVDWSVLLDRVARDLAKIAENGCGNPSRAAC